MKLYQKLVYYFLGVTMGFAGSIALADPKRIDLTRAGLAFWIFVMIVSVVIMMQVIPAIIVFTTLIGRLLEKKGGNK